MVSHSFQRGCQHVHASTNRCRSSRKLWIQVCWLTALTLGHENAHADSDDGNRHGSDNNDGRKAAACPRTATAHGDVSGAGTTKASTLLRTRTGTGHGGLKSR